MTMMYVKDKRLITWSELVESFDINPTDYGTDLKNKDFIRLEQPPFGYEIFMTLFEKNHKYYMVALHSHTGSIAFAVSDTFVPLTYDNAYDEFARYSTDRVKTDNALRVFGSIFYVVLELIKHASPSYIRFDPADPQLGRVYSRLAKSNVFIKKLKSLGYESPVIEADGEIVIKKQ